MPLPPEEEIQRSRFQPARRACAALLALAVTSSAQVGTIEREQKIAAKSGGFKGILANDYRFGVSVAELGDFDGDGIRDLAVGAHRANIGGDERGAVWLLYLDSGGKVRDEREISALSGGLTGPLDDHDRFGISLSPLGDLDHDGTVDLAVGTYRDDDGGLDVGAVYILFLAPDGSVKAEHKIDALSDGLAGALQPDDSFGWSVEAVGDLDDDGVVDLAVGATRDDATDPDTAVDYGAVYLLFLNADGTVKTHTVLDARVGSMGKALRPRDRFGSDVVPLEDADGDGFEDIAVGAFGDDPLKVGKVFVVHLGAGGTLKSFQEIGRNTGGFSGLLDTGDRFGISLASDDLDGDGLLDLYVGAAGDDDGGMDAGAVWVCLLNSTGRVRSFEKISPLFGGFGGVLHDGDTFGIACTTLGDVDRDGAVDLAVGAYQDDEGGFDRGAAWVLFRAGVGLPVADFKCTPSGGYVPVTVTFTDRSTGAISGRHWDFGDGTSSTETNPVHAYTTVGHFTVTLTVDGPFGTDRLVGTNAIEIAPPEFPAAGFSVAPATGPVPLAATFTDRSTGSITAWAWDFGDGATSTLRSPQHTFEALGTYTVSLTVTGGLGSDTRTMTDLISVVEPPPVADFLATPGWGPAPLGVAFTDRSSPNVSSWAWDFGDGATGSGPNPVHTYAQPGSFDVKLTVAGPTGSTVLERSACITAVVPLIADFVFTPATGMSPITVQFTDRSLNGATAWSWDFGDGSPSSSLQNPAHLFAFGGNLQVTLTVTGRGLVKAFTAPITINEPRPVARFTASPTRGQAPLMVHFTDTSTGHITGWEWDFGDGTGSFRKDPTHLYEPGTYTVRFRATSFGGVAGFVRRNFITVTAPTAVSPTELRRVGGIGVH